MSQFEWHTEESWGEDENVVGTADGASLSRFVPYLLLLLVCAVGVGVIWGYLREQVESATDSAESDLRATYDLLYERANAGDLDMFTTFLSGSDPDWTKTQQQLVVQGTLLERDSLGLTLRSPAPIVDEVIIAPDSKSAEINGYLVYHDRHNNPVTLNLPTVLRRGENNWLYAPPTNEFWGETITLTTKYLYAYLPARDAEIGRRLLDDFDASIAQLCETDCPDEQVVFNFNTSQQSLHLQRDRAPHPLPLPAPSLVGIPADSASYASVRDGYLHLLLPDVMARMAEYECCDHLLYFEALVAWQLAELGVGEWGLDSADYATLLDKGIAINPTVDVGWDVRDPRTASDDQRQAARAIVEFLLRSDPALTPLKLQKQLGADWQQMHSWVKRVMALNPPETGLGVDWGANDIAYTTTTHATQFMRRMFIAKLPPPADQVPTAFPEQHLLVSCTDSAENSIILRHNLQSGEWIKAAEFSVPHTTLLASLPNNGLLLDQSDKDLLWRANEIVDLDAMQLRFEGPVDPLGQHIVVRSESNTTRFSNWGIVDTESCSGENCPITPVANRPDFAPDGQHYLVRRFGSGQVYNIAGERLTSFNISNSFATLFHWLDDTHYLWQDTYKEYVTTSIGADDLTPLFSFDDLNDALPEGARQMRYVANIEVDPTSTDLVFINAFDNVTPPRWQTFLLNRRTTAITWVPNLEQSVLTDISPSGKWLLAVELLEAGTGLTAKNLVVYNTETTQKLSYPVSEFSAEFITNTNGDEWLLLYEEGTIRLIAPDYNFSTRIVPPLAPCTSALWQK